MSVLCNSYIVEWEIRTNICIICNLVFAGRHIKCGMLYFMNFGGWTITVETAVKNIQDIYQDRAIQTVKKCFAKFKHDDFDLDDQPRSD